VTKLQTALGYTTEQIASLPPPLAKIRELEQEILKLHRENDELRRLLDPDRGHRPSLPSLHDTRSCDRDPKRRKTGEEVYAVGHSWAEFVLHPTWTIEFDPHSA
jgi:hypothetical protein